MDSSEIIKELQSQASEKYKANVVKMGIPEEYSIGVSTGEIRNKNQVRKPRNHSPTSHYSQCRK